MIERYEYDELIGFCRDLIKIPGFAGNEEAVIKRAHEELIKLDFDHVEIDNFGAWVVIISLITAAIFTFWRTNSRKLI